MNTNIKCDYDEPTVLRKAMISHFNDKYDTPVYYHNNNNNQNMRIQSSHYHQTALRSSKSLGNLTTAPTYETTNLLSESESSQIENFFRAHKTHVYVGRCLVNLYFTKTDLINGGRNSKPRIHEWELSRTGVPVIIFDKGETRARDKRQLQICLAEKGTGFVLWKDIIDNLSDYSAHHPCFHTLYLSCDHRRMAGLSFDSPYAANQFHEHIETLTADPLNIALTGPKKSGKKLNFLKKSVSTSNSTIYKLPKKCDISSPCLFQHITNVEVSDYDKLYSLSSTVPYNHYQYHSSTPSVTPTTSTSVSTISSESMSNTSL
ncbi:uncharacterized protein LOC128957574 [Oppia nitens]|uniref:uncharacterized protein LOC128957574 n=1 Tax=Oppia nitens TaxID=1686743 RepID=UPI0023DA380A|nr:uncharacterized protein LOC128957574 [Oppia nitens]